MKYIAKIKTTIIALSVATVWLCLINMITSTASFRQFKGVASWYSKFSPGIKTTTASMEIFDHNKMTCAMWGVPFGTIIEVTNARNGRKVFVRVNDRGPARRLYARGRIIDLTKAAFQKIEDLDTGLADVKIRIVG